MKATSSRKAVRTVTASVSCCLTRCVQPVRTIKSLKMVVTHLPISLLNTAETCSTSLIIEDFDKCINEGNVASCLMAASNFVPGGKGLRLALKAWKAARAARYVDDAGDAVEAVAKNIDDAADGASDLRKADACKNSFSGDTQILMGDGSHKAIKDVAPGDVVWAVDPETAEAGPRKVTHIWPHEDHLVKFTVGDDTVTTTEDHPFWNATDHVWQGPQDFEPGDMVLTADGQLLATDGLIADSWTYGAAYDLTVDDLHTYFVGVGDADVLVHNVDAGDIHLERCRPARGNATAGYPNVRATEHDYSQCIGLSVYLRGGRHKVCGNSIHDGRRAWPALAGRQSEAWPSGKTRGVQVV